MNPLALVLLGMAVVIVSVLVLRLHAFLAMLLAAVLVAALTPSSQLLEEGLHDKAFKMVGFSGGPTRDDPDPYKVRVVAIDVGHRGEAITGATLMIIRSGSLKHIGDLTDIQVGRTQASASIPYDFETGEPLLHDDDLIVHPYDYEAAVKASKAHPLDRIAAGFGKTCIDIGILIALAAIIGDCLLASGAAERIVRSFLRLLGEQRAPMALLGSGYILGIPVFFDTVFYLMIPLAKALAARTRRNYLLYVLAIVAGATMTHSLVPPTPGPLFVASAFDVNLGVMMIAGSAVSVLAAAAGYLYALWANNRWNLPLRNAAEQSAADSRAVAETDESRLPPLWLSFLPIVLPILLITWAAVMDWMWKGADEETRVGMFKLIRDWAVALGNKNAALLIAACIAMITQMSFKTRPDAKVGKSVTAGLTSAGMIILITAAGGAFGAVLRQTGIANEIRDMAAAWQVGLLPLAFAVTVLVRTAQGSATVAMITAAGVLSPLVIGTELAFHPVYLALAVGCGSKPIMWMNDSGFWVITTMSGMREGETLRSATVMMALMGVTGLMVVMLGAWVLPLV